MASSSRQGRPGRDERGFVLAVTLWLLAGIALVVGLMTLWALDEVRGATAERERLDQHIAMLGTRDTVLYLAATRDLTLAGLPTTPLSDDQRALRMLEEFGAFDRTPIGGELRLDGQPYLGPGGIVFSLQDEAGLLGMVLPSPRVLDDFLEVQGVAREDIPRLRDTLLDYTDADTLRRLNGAEAREYRRASRPPPPNRRLLLPSEISDVLGWSDLPPETLGALPDQITTFYAGAFNPNTAPASLLPTWVEGCPEICDAIVERRQRQPFQSSHQLTALLGTRLKGEQAVDYRYLASDTLRLTLWGDSGMAWRLHVRLTPLADQRGPWSVLAAYPVSRPASNAPAQPTDSALFADPQTARP